MIIYKYSLRENIQMSFSKSSPSFSPLLRYHGRQKEHRIHFAPVLPLSILYTPVGVQSIIIPRCLVNAEFTFSESRSCYGNLGIFRIYGRAIGVADHNAVSAGWTSFWVRWRRHGVRLADNAFLPAVRMLAGSQAGVRRMSSSSWIFSLWFLSATVKGPVGRTDIRFSETGLCDLLFRLQPVSGPIFLC
jgi:hypothetical protein